MEKKDFKERIVGFVKKHRKPLIITSSIVSVLGIIAIILIFALKKEVKKIDNIGLKVDKEDVVTEHSVEKEGYMTFALYGLDNVEEGVPRTDTIIIANVNKDTGDVQLVSVCRDTFVLVDKWSERKQAKKDNNENKYTRINHAYQFGVEESIKALNQNFALHITDYVAVDFTAVAKIVDAIGGIEVTIPDKANFVYYLNGAGRQAATIDKQKYPELSESSRGKTVTLSGYQALGYCRVRKPADGGPSLAGESDFTRSARQQEIINKVVEKIKSEGSTNAISLIKNLFSVCTDKKNMFTSFELSEIIDIASDALKKGYTITEEGKGQFPFKPHEVKMWSSKMSTQFSDNTLLDDVIQLHEFLYPDKTVTDDELKEVKEISNQLEKFEKQYYAGYKEPTTRTPASSSSPNSTASADAVKPANPTASASSKASVKPSASSKPSATAKTGTR